MKKKSAMMFACSLVALLVVTLHADSNDDIASRILDLYPQADTNGDGVLSSAEETALIRKALQKYPKADVDGDGFLSESEKKALLAQAVRANGRVGSSSDSLKPVASEAVTAGPAPTESSVRQGPRPVKPGRHGVGRQIPDLSFTDINGTEYKLSDFAKQQAVVFAMTGTGCPLCLKYSPSLSAIEKKYRDRGVTFLFMNPNESERGERLQDAVKTHGFQGPYVSDGKKNLSGVLGAETTTEVFVLDRARTLVYRGAVDDQYGFGYALDSPRVSYLTDALDAVLEGRTPDTQATSSPGCELFYDRASETNTKVTYHNRISRIIQANCIECHREGGIAPIALESYEQVKDYAGMIGNVVDRGIMPPWFAAPQPSENEGETRTVHWANDRSLAVTEKNELFAWIKAGAAEGDPADAPLPKTFPDGWLIGKPDVEFEFPEPIPVKTSGTMPYKYVTVETDLAEDKWVQAIEIRPGQIGVVHHVIVSVQTDGGGTGARGGLWAGYAPGNSTWVYPDGYARRLPKGAKLRFQMHYTPNGRATEDSTRIGIIFAKEPPRHEVKVVGIANRDISITPGADDHQEIASLRLPYDIQILSFLPHMHLRGKAARYEALTADGTETLLDVPHYDFNWQLLYRLARPLTLSRGDTIRFTGWFDNSENNPANPDPGKTVLWGQQTESEMLLGYVEYIVPGATPGDPVAGLGRARRAGAQRKPADSAEVQIGGQRIDIAALLKAIRDLDKNGDGKLEKAEVPAKRQRLFDLLDANKDDVLTTDEAQESMRTFRDRLKRD